MGAWWACGLAPFGPCGDRHASGQDVWNHAEFVTNQSVLERAWERGIEEFRDGTEVDSRTMVEAPAFEEPLTIVRHVLRHTPPDAVVHPSEGYYYFSFPLGHRIVSGNLRFSDVDEGMMSVGYFDAYEPRDTRSMLFGQDADGDLAFRRHDDGSVTVRAGDVERRFTIRAPADLPRPTWNLPEGLDLLSSLIDESGVPFALLYDEEAAAFMFALHDELASSDDFVHMEERSDVLIGRRSRFVLYRPGEDWPWLLVGVLERNSRDNNWFDGPFDQVPPRLDLKDRLERAYPYVKERGGIDRYGRFVELEGQRVAITPYQYYSSVAELMQRIDELTRGHERARERALAATYESKRDFHLKLPVGGSLARSLVELRARWPANHWARLSLGWPEAHAESTSGAWPANHGGEQSAGRGP